MKRYFTLLLILSALQENFSQELSPVQLLEKAINYHDPDNSWKSFKGALSVTMQTPNAADRISDIIIDLPKEYFNVTVKKEKNIIEQTIVGDSCFLALNGSTTISKKDAATLEISCEKAKKMKDYFTYLYGLPMKLKDPGTLIDSELRTKSFQGKTYLALKVTYEATVGKDTWYFYFNPVSYALEVYQFFHNEATNDGEYSILSEEILVNGIKIPKIRTWYSNKDDVYLGTDILTKASEL